jgi:hypothetical protein
VEATRRQERRLAAFTPRVSCVGGESFVIITTSMLVIATISVRMLQSIRDGKRANSACHGGEWAIATFGLV